VQSLKSFNTSSKSILHGENERMKETICDMTLYMCSWSLINSECQMNLAFVSEIFFMWAPLILWMFGIEWKSKKRQQRVEEKNINNKSPFATSQRANLEYNRMCYICLTARQTIWTREKRRKREDEEKIVSKECKQKMKIKK
jgi:hypothetical protein